jgi:hypothetical protein
VDDKDEEDGAGLYTLDDDKADGDDLGALGEGGEAGGGAMVIIEEEASVVPVPERAGAKKTRGVGEGGVGHMEDDEDDEDEKDDEDGDGDVAMDGGWEDAWEQEV